MNIGVLLRADKTGLANQTWEVVRHCGPVKVLHIDLSDLSSAANQHRFDIDQHILEDSRLLVEWFGVHRPRHFPLSQSVPQPGGIIDEFLSDLDVLYTAETPYDYWIFERAAQMGVKTVLHLNYEFLDYLPFPKLPKPTLFMAPSLWHYEDIPFENKVFQPMPVDRDRCVFKERDSAQTFLHLAGNLTGEDRNGTNIFLESLRYVKSDVRFVVQSLFDVEVPKDSRLEVRRPKRFYWDSYSDADVLVMPRKFGGLCLPLNEAMSCGTVPLMTYCQPQQEFLLPDMMVIARWRAHLMTRALLTVHDIDPIDLAQAIDRIVELEEFPRYSEWCDEIAEFISWRHHSSMFDDLPIW